MCNGNDMAFPVGTEMSPNDSIQYGLTKREYIAAQVFVGIQASMAEGFSYSDEVAAAKAVKCADLLLAELAK